MQLQLPALFIFLERYFACGNIGIYLIRNLNMNYEEAYAYMHILQYSQRPRVESVETSPTSHAIAACGYTECHGATAAIIHRRFWSRDDGPLLIDRYRGA